jgi:6-phosphogluconolactonase
MKYISDPSNDRLVTLCAEEVVNAISQSWINLDAAHIVLTGGRTGFAIAKEIDLQLFRLIRQNSSFEGSMLHIWFSDERFVAYADPDRNDTTLINGFALCKSNIVFHRVAETGEVEAASARYAGEVQLELGDLPFDAVTLSMGEDGHIASLFPGLIDISEHRAAIAVHNSPKAPLVRVSLSLSRIAKSKSIYIFVLGESKAAALQNINQGPVGLLEKSSRDGQLTILTDLSIPA